MNLYRFHFILALFFPLCSCQKSATWEDCRCKWEKWEGWSKCNKRCYGFQIRYRAVWKSNRPECAGLTVCDKGKGGHQVRRCNKNCTTGQWDPNARKCVCPAGKLGVCCDEDVRCKAPKKIEHGKANGSLFVYGEVIGLDCDEGYKLVGSHNVSCGLSGWDGVIPKCASLKPCSSKPCPSSHVCVEEGVNYRCECPKGMYGATCNIDRIAPNVFNCSDDVTLRTANRREEYKWTEPSFVDPLGKEMVISKNYATASYLFPWGDFGIQYIAVKKENGLQSKCEFTVRVRPRQCRDLSVPGNGYVVCNNWHTDFGRFCLFGCKIGYSLPANFDGRQWLVCGSSGQWTPGNLPLKCEEDFTFVSEQDTLPGIETCHGQRGVWAVKKFYIDKLRASSFKSFCLNTDNQCNEQHVSVVC